MATPPEASEEFFAQFLDDYYAECEEHLDVVRHTLLALSGYVGQPQVDRSLIDELFRRFHTLKGLSGMVGVKEAERLAHQMESYLRALRNEQVAFGGPGLDALMAGVRVLEQVIAAHRAHSPLPDVEAAVARLGALLSAGPEPGREVPSQAVPGPEPTRAAPARPAPTLEPIAATPTIPIIPAHLTLSDEIQERVAEALKAGRKIWRFRFAPTPALASRGINVNTIRSRLQEVGELIHAQPALTAPDQIAFEFLLAGPADESAFAGWQADGLTWEPYTPAPAPETPPAQPPAERPAVALPAALTPSNIVRVDLSRLDELMRVLGELVISRARLEDCLSRLERAIPAAEWRSLQEVNQAMERQLRELREGVMRVRMVPIGEVFARLQFTIYDLARTANKQVQLELKGQDTELDKFVVERMLDPLLHLVRNAVSHGLEPPAERVAQGKPAAGQIALRASTAGDAVVIEVEDDGRGVDVERVAARGRALGLIPPDGEPDMATILEVLCSPGFSTRDEADLASGRGMGMTVVRDTVQELGGTLALATQPGRGTRFTIQLPLTLAIADALIVAVAGQRFAVPLLAVQEVLELEPGSVTVLEKNEILAYRGSVLPLLRLAAFFGLPPSPHDAGCVLVVGSGLNAMGIVVDRVLSQREVVVRPLTDPLVRSPGLSGATELGDGKVVLILDVAALMRARRKQSGQPVA